MASTSLSQTIEKINVDDKDKKNIFNVEISQKNIPSQETYQHFD